MKRQSRKVEHTCPLCMNTNAYEFAPPFSGFCPDCESDLQSFGTAQRRVVLRLIAAIRKTEGRIPVAL